MNLELLESFGQNYPEEFDGSLDCISMAVTCQFNRCGEQVFGIQDPCIQKRVCLMGWNASRSLAKDKKKKKMYFM
jgi:hypothetical protein